MSNILLFWNLSFSMIMVDEKRLLLLQMIKNLWDGVSENDTFNRSTQGKLTKVVTQRHVQMSDKKVTII